MKSFALHLVVLFIVGTQYHQIVSIYSSPSSSSLLLSAEAATLVEVETTAAAIQPSFSTTTTNKIASGVASRTARDQPLNYFVSSNSNGNNINDNNGNNGRSHSTLLEVEHHHQQQQQQNEQQRQQKQNEQHQLQSWHQQRHSRIRQFEQTSKTPRTIQRLIGGHLKLSNNPVTVVTAAATTTTTTETVEDFETSTKSTSPVTRGYFRRKPNKTLHYRTIVRRKPVKVLQTTTTTTSNPNFKYEDYDDNDDPNDDEAFLEDPKEGDNWDNGILRLSAGAGKEDKFKTKKKIDPNKTLGDQVKDGKYGLIEQELFKKTPKRPGILSYLKNDEVPNDNEKNLGGLNEEDIWLAEDHLLVIKGGGLNENDKLEPWAPIDDYEAPDRQIKIPSNPKVPPPFPVQLGENEPLQFIGDNQFPYFNPTFVNESATTLSIYPTGNEGKTDIQTIDNNEKNIFTRPGTDKTTSKLARINNNNGKGYFYPQVNPAWNVNNETLINPFLNFRPFAIPPGGNYPTVDNNTDYIDEDDPSLYYPPPYSFVYKSNYSNPVPAGPLVPGIVLPPPPNAFSRLEDTTTRKVQHHEVPFKQILTRVQQYKPKTIVISTSSTPATTTTKLTTTTTTSPITPTDVEIQKEIIYAITQPPPSYGKVRYYTTPKQTVTSATSPPDEEIISFIPQVQPPKKDTLSKGNPIYYEYFDAKKTPPPTPEVYYKEYLPPTTAPAPTTPLYPSSVPTTTPPHSSPIFKPHTHRKHKPSKVTTIKPVLQKPHKYNPSEGKTYLTPRPYHYDDYVYITPHPEIHPNGVPPNFVPLAAKPNYNTKPIPDFDREVNSIRQTLQYFNAQQLQQNNVPRNSKSRPVYEYSFDATKPQQTTQVPQYDNEPFKPMVKYSPSVDDENGFKAIAYSKADDPNYYSVSSGQTTQSNPKDRVRVQIIYDSTPRSENYYPNQQQATQNTVLTSQKPWVSIEKQIVQEVNSSGQPVTTTGRPPKRRPSSRKIEPGSSNKFNGYYYGPTQSSTGASHQRQNNRYYEEPFSKHLNAIRNKIGEYQSRPQSQWSLENDTYVNYMTPRPPINTNAEPFQQYLREKLPTEPLPLQRQQLWSLENDTYINYIPHGRPAINPDAEFFQPRRPQHHLNHHHREPYRQPPQSLQNPHHYHQSQNQQQQPWNLQNDTYINYVTPRPFPNQNAEYLPQQQPPPLLPPQRPQQPYYQPPQNYHQRPPNYYNQAQRLPPAPQPGGAVYPGHSLQRDTIVNFRQPLPQLNPDSEFINPYQPSLSSYRQPPLPIKQLSNQQNQYGAEQLSDNSNYYPQKQYYQNNQRPQRPPK